MSRYRVLKGQSFLFWEEAMTFKHFVPSLYYGRPTAELAIIKTEAICCSGELHPWVGSVSPCNVYKFPVIWKSFQINFPGV